MYSLGFNEQFADNYDFVGFAKATGLKAPEIGQVYKDFKSFCWAYIITHGLSAISECFGVWVREQSILTEILCSDPMKDLKALHNNTT